MISVSRWGVSPAPFGIRAPDSPRRQIASSRTDTSQTGSQEQDAAVAILNIGGMNDGVEQQTQRIYEKVAVLLCLLSIYSHQSHADRYRAPFFSALDALAIDDGSGGAGFVFASLTALHIKRVMNAIER